MSTFIKNLSEPRFSMIKLGLKKCEGRLDKGDFTLMKKGDIIIFENETLGFKRSFRCRVTSTRKYESFEKYLRGETLKKCLPGVDSVDEGVRVYYKYYTEEDEKKI